MAFCRKCGNEIMDEAVICPRCGCATDKATAFAAQQSGNIGWGILGFLFPLVGLIMYLVWKNSKPADARIAGKGALISVILSVAFYIIIFVIALFGMAVA